MKRALLSGNTMTFTAPLGGVLAGHAYQAGDAILLIAATDADAGQKFIGVLTGIHELAKPTDEAWTLGDAIFWDEGAAAFTTDDDGGANVAVGVAAAAALEAAMTGTVRLHGHIRPAGGGGAGNPAGTDGAVQFNDGGSFGGDASEFTADPARGRLVLGGQPDGRAWPNGFFGFDTYDIPGLYISSERQDEVLMFLSHVAGEVSSNVAMAAFLAGGTLAAPTKTLTGSHLYIFAEGLDLDNADATIGWIELRTLAAQSGSIPSVMEFATTGTVRFKIDEVGRPIFYALPTMDPEIAGALWNDSGTVKVSAG